MSVDAARERGSTKRNLGRSCRHWEQSLLREPGLVPIQIPLEV